MSFLIFLIDKNDLVELQFIFLSLSSPPLPLSFLFPFFSLALPSSPLAFRSTILLRFSFTRVLYLFYTHSFVECSVSLLSTLSEFWDPHTSSSLCSSLPLLFLPFLSFLLSSIGFSPQLVVCLQRVLWFVVFHLKGARKLGLISFLKKILLNQYYYFTPSKEPNQRYLHWKTEPKQSF